MKDQFNNQFATQRLREETATTSGPGSAEFIPGKGEQTAPRATKKVVKKKLNAEEKDVEPKLAAGKAKVYMKDKWGWEEASSIPNRPSEGGFIYTKIYESENLIGQKVKLGNVTYTVEKQFDNGDYKLTNDQGYEATATEDNIRKNLVKKDLKEMKVSQLDFEPTKQVIEQVAEELGLDMENVMQADIKMYSDVEFVLKNIPNQAINSVMVTLSTDESEFIVDTPNHARVAIPNNVFRGSLNENYSRFKKETKTRTNEQQLHAAMRLAEKKINEANRILEYTAQLRGELNETRMNNNTKKLMEKVTRCIAEAYGKMKKLK